MPAARLGSSLRTGSAAGLRLALRAELTTGLRPELRADLTTGLRPELAANLTAQPTFGAAREGCPESVGQPWRIVGILPAPAHDLEASVGEPLFPALLRANDLSGCALPACLVLVEPIGLTHHTKVLPQEVHPAASTECVSKGNLCSRRWQVLLVDSRTGQRFEHRLRERIGELHNPACPGDAPPRRTIFDHSGKLFQRHQAFSQGGVRYDHALSERSRPRQVDDSASGGRDRDAVSSRSVMCGQHRGSQPVSTPVRALDRCGRGQQDGFGSGPAKLIHSEDPSGGRRAGHRVAVDYEQQCCHVEGMQFRCALRYGGKV